MDERKKNIKTLETQKQEAAESLNLMLENLGEARMNSMETSAVAAQTDDGDDVTEYQRLHKEIADSERAIKAIEANIARLRELEELISGKEADRSQMTQELAGLYTRLGELVLQDPDYEAFAASYQQRTEGLLPKIAALEDRLGTLDDKRTGVFSWIGKNAQSMVIRSFLGKSQDNLQRIYGMAGEQFLHSPASESIESRELRSLVQDIQDIQKGISGLEEELSALREERRNIVKAFDAQGKQTQVLEKHIAQTRIELRILYRKAGKSAASASIMEQDDLLLEAVEKQREKIRSLEHEIDQLNAALAIDEETASIEKLNSTIVEHRQRIAASEKAIADLETRIDEANRHIAALTIRRDSPEV
ncbi:MAG: hypothetical protein LBU17_02730 [Treponema sp.]|nr:hypothetical protein [Treponema sp.]